MVSHTAIMGVDFAHARTDTLASAFPQTTPLDIFNPNTNQYIAPVDWVSNTRQRQYQTGIYAQDQIKIDRLSILLGGRYDWSSSVSDAISLIGRDPTHTQTRQKAFTGRTGLIYNFDNGVAPYVSYYESLSLIHISEPTRPY